MNLYVPTLYKLDSKGKVRQWSIDVVNDNGVWSYVQTHGQQDGKMQTTSTKVLKGKNIGKANETTPEEQCRAEAQALWNKQLDRKGYTEHIPTEKPMRPMLAKKFAEDGKHIVFPCYTQPKLDGFRCWAYVSDSGIVLRSRTGKVWSILHNIQEALAPFFDKYPEAILDGELYNHDLREDFQKLAGAIKRDVPNLDSSLIQFHVYDIVDENLDFKDRTAFISTEVDQNDYIKHVETFLVANLETAKDFIAEYLNDGYEGGMLRNRLGGYKINGRSKDLQKYKEFCDDEFEIIGAEENKGKQEGECVLICSTKEGGVFSVKPKGSSEVRRQYWEDFKAGKLTGKMLTVRYFRMTTSNPPVPYAPVGIIIREDYE